MPKKLIKKWMPDPGKIKNSKSLSFLGEILHEPNLWHINRHAVSRAFLVGIFVALVPLPFQTIIAAFAAVWFNCNLPLTIALCWITNPFTMPAVFYFNYWVGSLLLGRPPMDFQLEVSWEWLSQKLLEVGLPLYLGSLLVATVMAGLSYVVIEWLWRRKVRHDWEKRIQARLKRRTP